jgi:hypothetical protein
MTVNDSVEAQCRPGLLQVVGERADTNRTEFHGILRDGRAYGWQG